MTDLQAQLSSRGALSARFILVEANLSIDQCITAWLHEKKTSLSESERTYTAYQHTLADFRDGLLRAGFDLDAPPHLIATAAQGWLPLTKSTHRREVTPATYNQRRAILSSFYGYAVAHEVVTVNPMLRVKARRQQGETGMADALEAEDVKAGLARIDRSTLAGKRDYALLSVALSTGRRVSELAALRYTHLAFKHDVCSVTWERCKGNKLMEDVLPPSVTAALVRYLEEAYRGKVPEPDAPVWVSVSRRNPGAAIETRTMSNICKKFLGTSKVHAIRHTTAITMQDSGASLQEIGAQLGHSNLKTTADYLEKHQARRNPYAAKLAAAFGIE